MNAASNAPDDGLTEQSTGADAGPIPGPPDSAGPRPGTPAQLPVRRPSSVGRPAPGGLGGESDWSAGSPGSPEVNQPSPAAARAVDAREGNAAPAGRERPARLLEGDELQRAVTRWKEIQAHFVDEPRTAVEQADALVAGLMRQLAALFARERGELGQSWAGGNEVSTEELRQSLRRYRSFFERLLAA